MFLFFGSILLVLAAALIVHSHFKEKERRARFQHFASAWGLSYSPDKERDLKDRFPGFPLFGQGTNRFASNFLTGWLKEQWLVAFDYHYQITWSQGADHTQSHTQHYYFTVIMLQPAFPLKPLMIREHRFTDRIAAAFGWRDIDFESAEFSRLYHVTAPERRWAFDVLTPRTIEFLMARRPEAVHMDDTRVMMVLDRVSTPHDILPACEVLSGLLTGIPDYARRGPGGGGGPPPLPARHSL